MARTTSVVQRAVTSWCQIFLYPIVEFCPEEENCSEVAKAVKSLLRCCPSSCEAEVMAWQSIKKLLPPSCKCMEKELLENLRSTLTSRPRILPPGYVGHVKKTVGRMFRKGWDAGLYSDFCYTNTPGLAGTVDSTRLQGGCLGAVQDQVELLDRTLGLVPYETVSCDAQLMVVQSAGKPRPLTKFRSSDLTLRPLHKSLYEHLSRTTRWLCRGDPTAEKLKRAGFVKGGGVLVSGDYRSATDNLSLEVAELILDVILENTVSVPHSVKEHARLILRPILWNVEHGLEFEVSRGQMMGSYLSFPLLCLQNFLSFDFARVGAGLDRCPLMINGDDILFQVSDETFPRAWMGVVKTLGLEVEETKTSVSAEFGTLNSTLFEWEDEYLTVTQTLRFGMLRPADYVNSLGTCFHSFTRGQRPDVLWRAARTFFSWHLAELKAVRLRPDELGFRGALAFRMSRIFGLLDGDLSICQLPRAPIPHNVVYDQEHVTMVPEEALSQELKVLNSRQMASWKFSVDFVSCQVRASLRYCLQLSLVRRPVVDFSAPRRILLTDDFSWRKVRRRRFFRPLFDGSREIPVFDCVLLSQAAHSDWEAPPSYEDTKGVFETEETACVAAPGKEKLRRNPREALLGNRRPDVLLD